MLTLILSLQSDLYFELFWRSQLLRADECGIVRVVNSPDWPTMSRDSGGSFALTGHDEIYRTEELPVLTVPACSGGNSATASIDDSGNVYLPAAPGEQVEVNYLHLLVSD